MLSEMLRPRIADNAGREARVEDLVIDLATGDYPPVTLVVVRVAGEQDLRVVPWTDVRDDGPSHKGFTVDDLNRGEVWESDHLDHGVRLKRDVLDAQVLDLSRLQATRANDLWLERVDDRLELRAIDISPAAVLRRLFPGLLGSGSMADLLDWKHVEFLRGDAHAARVHRDNHRRVERLQPVQIARLVDEVPYLHAAELVTILPDALAADTLEAMTPERQVQVFEELDDDYAVRVLGLMAPDRATDLVSALAPEIVERCLTGLPKEQRERIVALLRFPDDVAGGIMTNDVVLVRAEATVAEARELMSDRLRVPDFVYFLYAVDDEESSVLRGVVTLREFVIAEDDRRIDEIMQPNLVTIDPLDTALEAARRVADSGLAALPVVGKDGRLLGAVTLDAALTQLAPSWRAEVPRVFS